MEKNNKTVLLVLDFDNTIIHHSKNTTMCIQPLFPGQVLPPNLTSHLHTYGWDGFVSMAFNTLFETYGVTDREAILDCFRGNNFVHGMDQLIETISYVADIIVISDSHTIAVTEFLRASGMLKYVDKIYANPTRFTDEGQMVFDLPPKEWGGSCLLSGRKICKGNVMEMYMDQQYNKYDFVAYAGDGVNDLCPILRLRHQDMAFPRAGFPLEAALNETSRVAAHAVIPWSNGRDILKAMLINAIKLKPLKRCREECCTHEDCLRHLLAIKT